MHVVMHTFMVHACIGAFIHTCDHDDDLYYTATFVHMEG